MSPVAAVLAGLLALATASAAAAPRDTRVPGGVAVLPLAAATQPRPRARFAGRPVLVAQRNGRWQAYVGLPLDLVPGRHELAVESGDTLSFAVAARQYPVQRITLADDRRVRLSPDDAARAEREIAQILSIKQHWQERDAPEIDLDAPTGGRRSGRFGTRRIFNGEPRAPHSGLDLAVATGTPVKASAAGEVIAVGDYFFNGKTVFVDHGSGLITMVCHLERIEVAPGTRVDRGQTLGLSGASGRASGPHLHWTVVLNGANVDPELFLPAERRP